MPFELPDLNPFHHPDKDKENAGLKAQVADLGKKLLEAQAEIKTLSENSNDSKVTELTTQLQVMTGDRNEFRDKFTAVQAQLVEANNKINELTSGGSTISIPDKIDTGHHFGR